MADAKATDEKWRQRWKQKHNWTAGETAKLCCGWNPDDPTIPEPLLYARALEAVNRAVRTKALLALDLLWAPGPGDRMYGSDAYFAPASAAAWASKEYPDTFVFAGDPEWKKDYLDPREKLTLLAIIDALAHLAGIDLSDTASAADKVHRVMEDKGIARGKETIAKHLGRAHSETLPER